MDLLLDRFFRPNMLRDTEGHFKKCEWHLKFKAKPQKVELQAILVTYPLELVHMDYLTIESAKADKDVNILVITDHFMRFVQVIITNSQTTKTTAQALWDTFIVHYGLPESIVSNQGRNFESELVQELCRLGQVRKLCTTLYHPQCSGHFE